MSELPDTRPPEMLRRRPEIATSLSVEKAQLSVRLGELAVRRIQLLAMLAELEAESDTLAERVGHINEFTGNVT